MVEHRQDQLAVAREPRHVIRGLRALSGFLPQLDLTREQFTKQFGAILESRDVEIIFDPRFQTRMPGCLERVADPVDLLEHS